MGRCRKVKSEGTKGRERVVGKRRGTIASLYWAKAELADEVEFDGRGGASRLR